MSSDTFYNEHAHALKPVAVEARNALPALAVQLLIARNPDFACMSNEVLIQELCDIISELHVAYQRVSP